MTTRRLRLPTAAALAGLASLAACGEQGYEPPSREAQVAEAEQLHETLVFDTITWSGDEARVGEGNLVYATECRRCHGPVGRGETDYALQRGLSVPSLVEGDAGRSGDLEAVRRRIFTGHPDGMPTWGFGRLTLRQVDAVAYYIVYQLRPEVRGEATQGDEP